MKFRRKGGLKRKFKKGLKRSKRANYFLNQYSQSRGGIRL